MNLLDQIVDMVDDVLDVFIRRLCNNLVGDHGTGEFASEGVTSKISEIRAQGDFLLLRFLLLSLLRLLVTEGGGGIELDCADGGERANDCDELHKF